MINDLACVKKVTDTFNKMKLSDEAICDCPEACHTYEYVLTVCMYVKMQLYIGSENYLSLQNAVCLYICHNFYYFRGYGFLSDRAGNYKICLHVLRTSAEKIYLPEEL